MAARQSEKIKLWGIVQGVGFRPYVAKTAEALGISQGYLSTAFKKQTGESFTGFVSAVKIEKAKELIAGHQYMMYEISDMLGFDTPFYFSKVFKKIAGLSPKEYEAECFKAGHEV